MAQPVFLTAEVAKWVADALAAFDALPGDGPQDHYLDGQFTVMCADQPVGVIRCEDYGWAFESLDNVPHVADVYERATDNPKGF